MSEWNNVWKQTNNDALHFVWDESVHTPENARLGQRLNWAQLIIPARAENVALARSFLAGVLAVCGEPDWSVTLTMLDELKVALSEAVSNAIIHGYGRDDTQVIKVCVEQYAQALVVQVADRGVGIADIEQARRPDYTTGAEHLGLGFAFMESFCDEMEVQSAPGVGTVVTLVKLFGAGAA